MTDTSRVRVTIIGIVCVAGFVALFARLWFLQVVSGESFEEIEGALELARGIDDASDLASVQAARDRLEQATLPLATVLMDDVARAAVAGKRLEDV